MRDPIPPEHGEPEAHSFGRGSNTYSDDDWVSFAAWLEEVSLCHHDPARDGEELEF